ncbi:MAG: YcgN family cysteine cluster protein [Hyphomonadaceae bacterium]
MSSKVTLLDYRRSRRKRDVEADNAPLEDGYWRRKTLTEMNEREWEALCDRCGKCCVISIEDTDSGELFLTDVSCKLFDAKSCGCSDYANRKHYVPDCVKLTPKNVAKLDWLPRTCAYRLVSEGKDLYWWHPLLSGDGNTVHVAKVSVRNKTRPEGRLKMPGLIKRITKWPSPLEKPPAKYRKRRSVKR